jgi:hypothetical protein
MRKSLNTFIVFSFCFFLSANSFAQETQKPNEFKTGILGGLSTSQISGDNLGGFRKFGIHAGLFTRYVFTEKYSAQFEISFIQKGSRKTMDPDNNDYTFYQLHLNYIEVPLLFKYKHKGFVFEAGPYAGYLINFKEENENGELPVTRNFYKHDIGGAIGINYDFTTHLQMNWRYTNSWLPVRPHLSEAGFRLNRGQLNSVMSFTLHYQFN